MEGNALKIGLGLVKSLRLYQWSKGVFILMPIIFSQRLFIYEAFANTAITFILYGFAASGVYLVNDIIDVREDRQHPEKRHRPIASGLVSPQLALIVALIIFLVSVPAAFMLDARIGAVISVYLVLNVLYVFILKHAVIIDVFCLGTFFYLRILAGGIACGAELSNWIIMCTVLVAIFLGFNKRKYDLEYSKEARPVFSKYKEYFIDRMISIIAAAIVITYSLYVMDDQTIERFNTKNLIYSVPFVYYGIFRYMYLMDTKWFGGDPAKIILGDYKVQLTMLLWVLVCGFVIYFKGF